MILELSKKKKEIENLMLTKAKPNGFFKRFKYLQYVFTMMSDL
jgi:hypothetical protein